MRHVETCHCTKRTLEFSSEFEGDVVTKIWCPDCITSAPDDAIVFELCEPGEYAGVWGLKYNAGELKRLDPRAFRDTDDYYLSLLISGTVGPIVVKTHYRSGGYCRILGFNHGPSTAAAELMLAGKDRALADQELPAKGPPVMGAGKKRPKRRGAKRRK